MCGSTGRSGWRRDERAAGGRAGAVSSAAAPPPGAARPEQVGLGYFPGIDGLRAVAIVSVLIYHLRPGWLPGGFAGVDVFFVVSGFVVTASLVHLRFDRLRSLLAYFYARRIVRIVPALLVMLVPTALLTILFTPPTGFLQQARDTALAASFGASNVLLALRDSSYFDPLQELNPFLHSWTLGVEEQYYLLFPFFFFFCQRIVDDPRQSRRAAAAIALASLLSLSLAWWLAQRSPLLGFYLMPARFWELGSGMLLCLTVARWRPRLAALPGWAAAAGSAGLIAALGLAFAFPAAGQLPLGQLLVAVAATAGLIALVCARAQALPARLLAHPAPVFIGRISYSLYLWHWPVFVLFRWTVGLEGAVHALLATLLAFACAIASYFLVEQPVRRGARVRRLPRRPVLALGVTALVACAGTVAMLFNWAPRLTLSEFGHRAYPVSRPAAGCAVSESLRPIGHGQMLWLIPHCRRPHAGGRLFVIGDSHARTFEGSLRRYAAEAGIPVRVYWRYYCDVPSLSVPASGKPWCAAFYREAFDELEREMRPGDTLLMVSLHPPRIDRQYRDLPYNQRVRAGRERPAAHAEAETLLGRLARTGATLVIEAPGPLFRTSPFRCSDWFNRHNPACAEGFAIDRAEMLALRRPALEAMNRLAGTVPNLSIWDPFPILCPGDPCTPYRGRYSLYADSDHLSALGHEILYPHFRRAVAPATRPR